MKNRFALLVLLVTGIMISACHNKCCYPGPAYSLFAKTDIKEWTVISSTATFNKDTLIVNASSGDENFSMKIKYTGLGQYKLTGNQVRYYVTTFGNKIITDYYPDAAAESVLNITTYDSANNIVAGDFNLKLTKTPAYTGTNNTYPEKLNFSYGNFRIPVVK